MRLGYCLVLLLPSLVSAQPAQKLPGGAVVKPAQPHPVVPLRPPPSVSTATPEMVALQPLIGTFDAKSDRGATAGVVCSAVAAGAWLRCETRSAERATSLAALIGWDGAAIAYRAFVVDGDSGSYTFKGNRRGDVVELRAPGGRHITIALGAALVVTLGKEAWKLTPSAR